MAQGLVNLGGTRNFVQTRFGQIFNLRNSGFGATDRGYTETLPLIFQPINGFAAGGLGRGVSVEYTPRPNTTVRVFGVSNERQELDTESDAHVDLSETATLRLTEARALVVPPIAQEYGLDAELDLRRSRTAGFALDRVIGQKGLTGVSLQFARGRTPVFRGDVPEPSVGFQRVSMFATKTFVDNKNFERTTALFGLSFLRDSRFLGMESADKSEGYGCFIEVDTIPVKNHVALFARYDQVRPTTLASENLTRGGTVGIVCDIAKYARALFEYQRVAAQETSNGYRTGVVLNF